MSETADGGIAQPRTTPALVSGGSLFLVTATSSASSKQIALGRATLGIAASLEASAATTSSGAAGLTVTAGPSATGFRISFAAGVVYPAGVDSFSVPSDPANTPTSGSGGTARNHVQSHRDLGTAVELLERYAAQLSHDHGGGGPFPTQPLDQANTHQSPDTDVAAKSLHHTVGPTATPAWPTGGFQAAPSFHTHDYSNASGPSTLLNRPYVLCKSTTRPADPLLGSVIWETDTGRARIWAALDTPATPSWHLLPWGSVPRVAVLQTRTQLLTSSPTALVFQSVVEDTFGSYSPQIPTALSVVETGRYAVEGLVRWDEMICPDNATLAVCVNNTASSAVATIALRGGVVSPGFSQTTTVSDVLRLNQGDQITLRASYRAMSAGGAPQSAPTWIGILQGSPLLGSSLALTYLGA